MGIRRDCVSWDESHSVCVALNEVVCKRKDCKFFLRPEQKRTKDALTQERLERIGLVNTSRKNTKGKSEKERDRAAYHAAYYKNQYEERKARGVCVRCGMLQAMPGKVKCAACAERVRDLRRKNVV